MDGMGARMPAWLNVQTRYPFPGQDQERVGNALLSSIREARLNWICARAEFDQVCDPDLVDHAIYSVDAAQKRYMYLLRQAREMGVSGFDGYDWSGGLQVR